MWLIHLDRFTGDDDCPQGWGGLQIDPWIIREGLTKDVFLGAAKESGLVYTIRPEPQYVPEVIVLSSGLEVGFLTRSGPYSGPVGLAWLSRRLEVG